jgi:hypothetical protein
MDQTGKKESVWQLSIYKFLYTFPKASTYRFSDIRDRYKNVISQ